MNDQDKTKEELIQELRELRQTVSKLEKANSPGSLTEQELKLNKIIEERTAALKESNDQLIEEIVQHQQTVKSLEIAKEQLQTVLAAVPGTVSWISSDLHYIEVNQELADIFGIPRTKFPGKDIGFLGASSEFYNFVQEFFESSCLETNREITSIVNGEVRNYLVVAEKYNKSQAAFIVGIDITERKQAEEKLRTAKEQLETVLEAVPGTVSWISSDLHYIEVNQRLADIFGINRAEFMGQDIGFLGTSSEFNDFVRSFFESSSSETTREIISIIHGEPRNYLIVAEKYNENQAAFIVGIDITERKQAEKSVLVSKEKLETVLEAVPGMVSWVNSDLTYIEVNQKLADRFNLKRSEFVGQNIGFINKDSQFISGMADFFASSEQEITFEITGQYQNSSRNYLIVAHKYNQNQAAFVVEVDITEHRQIELKLGATQEKFQTILDTIPGIVSWISSDLHYLGVNKHLAETYNLPTEAFIGKNIGFLKASEEFTEFMAEFFASSAEDDYREISAYVNGIPRNYLIVAQKYAGGAAAFAIGIDISDRKRMEAALREAEEKYRTIFENAIEGIFQATSDGYLISANPALARIYGYSSPEEVIANFVSLQHKLYGPPEYRQQFMQKLQEEGAVVNYESQIYRQDGTRMWISENARAVYDRDHQLIRYEGTVEDITERKEAQEALQIVNQQLESKVEERTRALKESNHLLMMEISERQRVETALRQSEAELRVLFEAMTDVITVFDAKGRYVNILSTNSEVIYSPSSELIGKSVYEVLPPQQANLFMINIQQVLNTQKTVNIEYSLLASRDPKSQKNHSIWDISSKIPNHESNGSLPAPNCSIPQLEEIWFTANVSPLPDNCVIWVARNITERKQVLNALQKAEEKYRTIFENAAEGIFQTTPDGRFISVNPALIKMYGFSSEAELKDKLNNIAQQLYVNPRRRSEFIAQLEKNDSVSNFESEIYRGDGGVMWISENARVVRNSKGETLYYEGTIQDITKRKSIEIALRLEQEKSDSLLLNVLPVQIATKLKQNQHPIAQRFENVTILFADIVDFTGFSARISPNELVDILNQIFSEFDKLTEQHHLEKIKTIGDSYMVVGGLPTAREDHVEVIAKMALDMQKAIRKFFNDQEEPFQIRIGINTGPVVAGVIGIKKFSYDLWGDTVNVASRMESSGTPGKIQVTEATYQLLKDKFLLESRGLTPVKGKGEMMTYWLIDRAKNLIFS
ncbi:adenylate/guanylate cyclase domain-containing protein [Okeania sp.]|uniref:adenylate/guanylate cyclase domain-containing protein n=1 Tax=Okeania sp. TaxID=3100323 RepID=UPI002B4B1A20|nr:adenylate/guanylate cyclase domain-containing protein [Okeania sp.]MEB3341123.1 adenylate/guanylate cyclase domain-containing protein [Okeania sp.]